MRSHIILLAVVLALGFQQAKAQTASAEDPAHAELRTLRDETLKALNTGDLDGVLKHVHRDVVFTGLDGSVSRGSEQLKAYFEKMMKGPNRIVESVHFDTQVAELTILYGADKSTGISYGTSHDTYKLARGLDFAVDTKWSATLIKEQGQWLIASFHASADLFDNPLLEAARKMPPWFALGGAFVGVIAGVFIGRRMRKS